MAKPPPAFSRQNSAGSRAFPAKFGKRRGFAIPREGEGMRLETIPPSMLLFLGGETKCKNNKL